MDLRTIRRTSGIALSVGWTATAAVGLHALRARDGRGVAQHIAIEILCGVFSLGATVVYVNARLARYHIDDVKWALNAWESPDTGRTADRSGREG